MKKIACRALSFILAVSLLMSVVGFAQPEAYTIQMYKNGLLVDTYTVSAGNTQTLESGTVADGKYLKGWLSADGSVLYGNKITPDKDMELHALYGSCAKPVPGVNLFENPSMDEDLFDVRPSNGEVFFETENGNRVIRYKRNSGYASLMHYVNWDAGRKYDLSFKIKSSEDQLVWYNTRYKRESDSNIDRGAYAGANQAYTWSTYNYTFTIANDYIPSENDAITFFSDPGVQVEKNDNIYDDLSLIPYFRLSYNLNGGDTGAPASEYTLDKAYTINPSSVPERGGYTFEGWSLENNSKTTVTEVEFDDEDITLYAVWSMDESAMIENVASYIPATDKAGVADGTVTVAYGDYQTAELYYGDETGIFSDYTMLASLALTNGAASYTMSGNRALPNGASRIYVILKGEGMESAISYCEIPDENQLDITDAPLLSFYSISDIHVGNDYWPEMTVNRNRVVADIQKLSPDFVAIVGDLVDHGIKSEYDVLNNFLDTSFNNKNIPAFITNGNHELFDINYQHSGYDTEALYNAYNKQLGALGENPDISISRDENSLFYSATFKDRKLIFMSTPEISGNTATYNISTQQLEWLDEQLYDGEKSNMTTFVFSHIGLKGYIPNRLTTGLDNTDAVVEILNRHPNAIIMSGHTHTFLDDDAHITIVGDMQNTFTALNDGCAIWLNSIDGEYFKDYSMGQYIEVYSDKILVKARQFTEPGMFISKGLYIIETPDSKEEAGTAQIYGNVEDGSILTAKLDGEDAPEGSTYEWRIGSTVVGTEKNYTVETKPEYAGKKIVLRITLPNGLYSSCISEKISADIPGSEERDPRVWDGSIDTTWANNYDTTDVFTITTAAQLAGLRNLVWEGKNFANKAIYLGADIDLNNLNWKYGIGGRKDNTWGSGTNLQFKGTFAGNGYIVKNLSINPNLADASAASNGNVSDEILSKNIAIGFLGYTAGAAIGGINLENVTITLHNKQGDDGNKILYQIGGLAGFTADSAYTACSVKNISFCGGWAAYAATPADLHIGGMIGAVHNGSVYNSYVNGIDFTGVTKGRVNSRAYKAGLACVTNSGATINNVYVVNMKYDKNAQTELWAGHTEYDMRNFDTVILCRKNNDTSYYTFNTSGNIYTDNYDHRREADLLTGVTDSATAVLFDDNTVFAKATKGENEYTTMVDLKEFGIQYPVTAAEKVFAAKVCFYDGEKQVSELSEVTGEDITIKFKSYNTTGASQSFDVIAGKYTKDKLDNAEMQNVTLSVLVPAEAAGRWDVWNPWAYGKTTEDLNNAQITEGSISISKGSSDSIKVFCWDSVDSLKPILPASVLSE